MFRIMFLAYAILAVIAVGLSLLKNYYRNKH